MKVQLGKESIRCTNGVPQGMCTSPLLFNIITDSLLKKLNYLDVESIMFADDLAIIANSWSELNKAIDTVNKWAK